MLFYHHGLHKLDYCESITIDGVQWYHKSYKAGLLTYIQLYVAMYAYTPGSLAVRFSNTTRYVYTYAHLKLLVWQTPHSPLKQQNSVFLLMYRHKNANNCNWLIQHTFLFFGRCSWLHMLLFTNAICPPIKLYNI